MNETEKRALQVLHALGITEIVDHTHGHAPPDFVAHSSIGIEVTRLNRAVQIEGKDYVLDSDFVSIASSMEKVLNEFPRGLGQSTYLVSLHFGRPFDRKRAANGLRMKLNDFLATGANHLKKTQVSKELGINVKLANSLLPKAFIASAFHDGGGAAWMEDSLCEALLRVAAHKRARYIKGGATFLRRWLLLENTMTYGVPDEIRPAILSFAVQNFSVFEFWERCILYNPLQPAVRPFIITIGEPEK